MKINSLKRIFVVILAVVMVLSLVACGQKDKKTDNEGTVDKSAGNVTYPLSTDVELNIWCGNQMALATDISSWEASPFHSGLESLTGVKMNWLWPTKGADVSQAYNLLWTDYDVPDIIFHNVSNDDAKALLEDGYIYDLTEYLPEYAPNYWKWLNQPENEDTKKSVQLSDGSYFSVASMKEDAYSMVWIGPIVRQDWLDECGLKAPVTLADWENVLTVFKEKYGATLSFKIGEITYSGGLASGTGALGFLDTTDFRVTDDGTVVIPQIEDGYKELLEIMVRWWEKGLIDHDSLSMSDDALRQKTLNGKAGIVFASGTGASNIITDAANEKNGANWVGLSYPRTAEGEPTSMICHQYGKSTGYHAMISAASSEEELIAALRWLDYGWTEEGMMYWNFGTEGISYQYDKDGKPQWSEIITTDPLGLLEGAKKYRGTGGSAPVLQMRSMAEANNVGVGIMDSVIKTWMDNTVADKHMLPTIDMEETDRETYEQMWAAISTYIDEESMKMFTGKTPITQYDAFVKKLYDMGLQDVLDIKQKYYDEYMK